MVSSIAAASSCNSVVLVQSGSKFAPQNTNSMYSQYSGTSFIHGAAAACARIINSYALLWSSWDIDIAKCLVVKQLRVVLVRDEAQPPAASSAVAFCLCSFSRSLHVCIKSITERMHMYMLLTSINAPCMRMSSIAILTFCVRL